MGIHVAEIGEIETREGFRVTQIRARQKLVRLTLNGSPRPYPFERAMRSTCTVRDYIEQRFQPAYPGCTCVVLLGDGRRARGNTTLATVRRSY